MLTTSFSCWFTQIVIAKNTPSHPRNFNPPTRYYAECLTG